MNGKVPVLSIILMFISCITVFLVPVFLFGYFRQRKKADILPFFVGCLVMILFAFVIEAGVNKALYPKLQESVSENNYYLLALYGGLMAGLFEECGRYIAFRTVLRGRMDNDANALMYGAGHGGIEAVVLFCVLMINNMATSFMINSGNISGVLSSLSGTAYSNMEANINLLTTLPPYTFFIGAAERFFAISIHISLSVIVWTAAKNRRKRYLFPVAIFIHFVIDSISAGLGLYIDSKIMIELVIMVMAVLLAIYSRRIYGDK